MTREQIRATIEGLERIARGECHSYSYKEAGSRSDTARDALTLLREVTENDRAELRLIEVLNDLDRERKAVSS